MRILIGTALNRELKTLKHLLFIVIFLGIICGFFIPAFHSIYPGIPYFIGIMLFFNFLEIETSWRRFFRPELIVTLALSALFMPLVVYYILSRGLSIEYRIGLFLTAIAPSGIMMLVFSRFVPHKDYNLIISNFLATQFGTVLYLPLMTQWVIGAQVSISAVDLFFQTAALVVTPYCVSLLVVKAGSPGLKERLSLTGRRVIPLLVFLIISSSISGAAQDIQWDWALFRVGAVVLLIYFLQGGLAYAAGFLFGDKSIRNTLALVGSSRNIQLVLGIAVINFPPLVIIPMVLGIIFHHLTNLFWLWIFRK
ncbi:bile acid:sodium symporter family protein [candidate division KSB1 bacterium]